MNDENGMKLISYIWVMCELLFDNIKYEKLMFNGYPLVSLMIYVIWTKILGGEKLRGSSYTLGHAVNTRY